MKRQSLMIVLAVYLVAIVGCREPRQELTPDVQSEAEKIEQDKVLIASELADIERSRVLMETNIDEELEKIRKSIEVINQALTRIETRLVAMGAVAKPTQPSKPKRLPLAASFALFGFFLGSALLYLKLRSMRLREARPPRSEVMVREKPKTPPPAES